MRRLHMSAAAMRKKMRANSRRSSSSFNMFLAIALCILKEVVVSASAIVPWQNHNHDAAAAETGVDSFLRRVNGTGVSTARNDEELDLLQEPQEQQQHQWQQRFDESDEEKAYEAVQEMLMEGLSLIPSKEFDDEIPRYLQVETVNNEQECYAALAVSDVDQDRRVDSEEFIYFVKLMGPPGFLFGVDEFEQLPPTLQSTFIILACLCLEEENADPQCCVGENAHISNNGTYPGETPTPEQEDYLFLTCFLTDASIFRVIASIDPTPSPITAIPTIAADTSTPTQAPIVETDTPTPSPPISPTTSPTIETDTPTASPTTSSPTFSPVAVTTSSPTLSPSDLSATFAPTPTTATDTPTSSPSMKAVTSSPTNSPSMIQVTNSPTIAPITPSPTTMAPVITVSPRPTGTPTRPPTPSPTITPKPSEQPSEQPSSQPSMTPMPTTSPTVRTVDVVANVEYVIGIRDNASPNSYDQDLIAAMDVLAPDVATRIDVDNLGSTRRLRQEFQVVNQPQKRRRLVALQVGLPTTLDGTIIATCPDWFDPSVRCEDVGASIGLFLVKEDGDDDSDIADVDLAELKSEYESALENAILNGELQDALDVAAPDSVVYIVDSTLNPPDGVESGDPEPEDEGLSAGAVAGLSVVGAIGLIALVSVLFVRRGRNQGQSEYLKQQDEKVDLEDLDGDDGNTALATGPTRGVPGEVGGASRSMARGSTNAAEGVVLMMTTSETDAENEGTLGAAPPGSTAEERYSKSKIYVPPGLPTAGEDSSSHAGSSGWSSQGGTSTLDSSAEADSSASASTSEHRTSLAALGAASALAVNTSGDDDGNIHMTYSELDQAIQKGDWAAVGVTAALLASQSFDSRSAAGTPKSQNSNMSASINPSRAAELDRLVEAGDWEGVVAAAAKYDAQETMLTGASGSRGGSASGNDSDSQRSRGSTGSPSGASTGSGAGTSTFSGGSGTMFSGSRSAFTSSAGTTTSEGASSRAKQLEDIRAEVEELVRHVVPEEKDNIDEMLLQFRGREEELVETLRSMKERSVAQKARIEGQKRAKRDAKQTVEAKNKAASMGAIDNTGAPADDSWITEIENTPHSATGTLTGVIGAGGVAAAGGKLGIDKLEPPKEEDEDREMREMQDALQDAIKNENWEGVAEAASGLSGRNLSGNASTGSRTSSRRSSASSSRSEEIDSLVDRGDWDGVVAAASRLAAVGDQSIDSDTQERAERRQRRLKEEEEALAQADIWDAIAEQTKQEAMSSDAGAKVAADWAIARSLSALTKSQKRGNSADEEDDVLKPSGEGRDDGADDTDGGDDRGSV